MLSRTAINIIRKSVCNHARTLYCARDSSQSNFPMYHNNTKQHSIQQNYCNLYVARRFKSSRKKAADSRKSKNEDSDEEEEEVHEIPVGSKPFTVNISSIRLDAVSKVGFGISRNKIEEMFYASKFRINGKKVFKKSMEVEEGDEIDMIVHKNVDNPELLVVNRIIILSMSPGKNSVQIKLCRDKNLLIENYEDRYE